MQRERVHPFRACRDVSVLRVMFSLSSHVTEELKSKGNHFLIKAIVLSS